MQKVNVVCVGKIKESFFREAVAEYAKRLSRFVAFSVREIAEGKSLEAEADDILRAAKGYIIALCVEGRKFSSEALAAELKRQYDRGAEVTFIIGSSCGLAQRVKDAADIPAPAYARCAVRADLPRIYDKFGQRIPQIEAGFVQTVSIGLPNVAVRQNILVRPRIPYLCDI